MYQHRPTPAAARPAQPHQRLLSPADYARVSREVQAKQSWLLQDQRDRLDREIAEERAVLEARLAQEAKDREERLARERASLEAELGPVEKAVEVLRSQVEEITAERHRLRSRKQTADKTLKRWQSEVKAARELVEEAKAAREAIADQEAENQELAKRLAKLKREGAALRGRAERAEATIKKRQELIRYAPLTDEQRRLFDADNEIRQHDLRKRRAQKAAAEAAKTPGALLAG